MNEITETPTDAGIPIDRGADSLQTQAPTPWYWKLLYAFLSAVIGFWVFVFVSWKTGLLATGIRRLLTVLYAVALRIAKYFFDRYFDLRRLGEWMLMCISPQLYAAYRAALYSYSFYNGVRRTIVYVLDRVARVLAIFGIQLSTPALQRETSVDSLRRAPISRETSRVAATAKNR